MKNFFEIKFVNKEQYCGKLLFFTRDKKCSWHYHLLKDEVFYIHSGRLLVYYGNEDDKNLSNSVILDKGDNFHVPVGMRHQMIAIEDTEMYEFSTQHFDEDSYRIEKGD
jgi:mannose-6-phosphate isomerase-like protein (cupin superfamily)